MSKDIGGTTKILAYKYRYEILLSELADMSLCNRLSTCWNCMKKICPVREDAKRKKEKGHIPLIVKCTFISEDEALVDGVLGFPEEERRQK